LYLGLIYKVYMSTALQHTTETGVSMATKAAAPVTVSLATIAGFQVSEILLWATLVYTILMIGHKLYSIYKDIKGS
jgi:hypothetical protein